MDRKEIFKNLSRKMNTICDKGGEYDRITTSLLSFFSFPFFKNHNKERKKQNALNTYTSIHTTIISDFPVIFKKNSILIK